MRVFGYIEYFVFGIYMSDEKKFTSGNLWKQMLLFCLPLMSSNLLQVLLNMSDIAVVGDFPIPALRR